MSTKLKVGDKVMLKPREEVEALFASKSIEVRTMDYLYEQPQPFTVDVSEKDEWYLPGSLPELGNGITLEGLSYRYASEIFKPTTKVRRA